MKPHLSTTEHLLPPSLRFLAGGLFLAFIASAAATNQHLLVQLCQRGGMRVASIAFLQGVIGGGIMYGFMLWRQESDILFGPPEYRLLLWARSATITLAMLSFFLGIKYLPISVATLIFQLRPLAMCYAAWVVLGETFNLQQFLASFVMLAGQVLVIQPEAIFGTPDESSSSPAGGDPVGNHVLGVTFQLLNLFFSSSELILTRLLSAKAGDKISNERFFAMSCAAQTAVCGAWLLVQWTPTELPSTPSMVALFAALTVVHISNRLLTTTALRKIGALTLAIVQQFQVILSIFEELVVFGTHLNLVGGVGGVIVVGSGTWALLARDKETEKAKPIEDETNVPLIPRALPEEEV